MRFRNRNMVLNEQGISRYATYGIQSLQIWGSSTTRRIQEFSIDNAHLGEKANTLLHPRLLSCDALDLYSELLFFSSRNRTKIRIPLILEYQELFRLQSCRNFFQNLLTSFFPLVNYLDLNFEILEQLLLDLRMIAFQYQTTGIYQREIRP